jgi:hypothetical protein
MTATTEQWAWVSRVFGVAPTGGGGGAGAGLAAWQTARSTAISTLNKLADAVKTLDIPEATEAVILLRAIRANLTEAPTTSRQIAELRRYLTTDEIITDAQDPNGFGIEVRLREPLLAALDRVAGDIEPGERAE